MINTFKDYLDKTNLSENSKFAYLFALKQFSERYGTATKKNLTAYKVWLVDNFKPQTVNLRLRGMHFHNGTYLLGTILSIPLINNVPERSKIVISHLAVNPIVDSNKANIVIGKILFRIKACL